MNASFPASCRLFLRLAAAHFRKALFAPLCVVILLASQAASAATYTVTNTLDSGAGSLRDALASVNTGSGGDTVVFSGVTGTITLSSMLTLSKSVTITGPGANILTVSGNDTVGVFNATAGTTTTISGLTIAHGFATAGAGIYSNGSALTVNNCIFTDNAAYNSSAINVGGAINAVGSTALTVNSSTFLNNKATGANAPAGGAIYGGGTTVVNNSTFLGNSAQANGGAIATLIGSRLTVRNSTIYGNRAATDAGIYAVNTIAGVSNSIVSGNTGGDCSRCSGGTNLIGGTAALGPLQNNGGPTPTMMPLSSSTGIIGAGLNSTLAVDQRGFVRPTSGASDLGAVQTHDLTVTTLNDNINSGTTCTGGSPCSLRDAITLANSYGSGDLVTLTGLEGTIALGSPLPEITGNLNIAGPGANLLTVSGGNATGVFDITGANAVVNIAGVTIANGNSTASAHGGAGINNLGASLTLSNCELTNNSSGGQDGGGLANGLNSSATVTSCTFSGNSGYSGGAIVNSGNLLVTNSTFFGNTAQVDHGGGILNQGLAQVTSSTFSGNAAAGMGGGIHNSSTMTLNNSIVAGNSEAANPGEDCSACGSQSVANLFSVAGAPVTAAQVMLAPLAYYGLNQTVRTMLPLPGSPAIQMGDPTLLTPELTTDQRQLPRTVGDKLDLGAVEANYTSVQFVQQPTNTAVNVLISPAVTMSVTESGTTAANIPLPITFAGTGTLHGTLTESSVAPTIAGDPALASFADLSVDKVGTGDTLTVTLTVTSSGIAPAQTLTATSDPFDVTQITTDVPTVTVGPANPVYGQPDTVTITVPTTGSTSPTGTVTIYNNGNPIGTGILVSNGTVMVTIPGGILPAGTNSITVGYAGDGNYGSSTSAPVPVTVAPVTGVPTLTVGPASPTVGQPATITVTVPTVGSTPATGTVTIYNNGNPIGTGTLGPDGTVTVNIPGGLPAGTNTLTAGYAGAGNYGPATSAPATVMVTDIPVTGTTTSVPVVSVGPTNPVAGQPVTVTVTVPTVGSTTPVGTVTIYYNGNPIGTGTLGPNGTVTVTIPGGLPVGTGTITVGYAGSGIYTSSTSTPASVTVAAAAVLDFTLTQTTPVSQTVISGAAATIGVQVAPTNGTYPGIVSFAATGLPSGATATFTPATVAANGGSTAVNLTVQTASLLSMSRPGSNVAPVALGLFLLPLFGAKRRRLLNSSGRTARYIFMMFVLLAGIVTAAGLTGCGTGNGFFGHAPKTYSITITATSGTIQHSVNATLNVQ